MTHKQKKFISREVASDDARREMSWSYSHKASVIKKQANCCATEKIRLLTDSGNGTFLK